LDEKDGRGAGEGIKVSEEGVILNSKIGRIGTDVMYHYITPGRNLLSS
jgi:hypothetical protein